MDKVLLSQDIFLKMFLKSYGGYGYSHILENFIPRLKQKGVGELEINKMLIDNPKEEVLQEIEK